MSLHAKNIACNLCQHLTLSGTQEVLVDPWKRHCLYAQIKRVHEFTGIYVSWHAFDAIAQCGTRAQHTIELFSFWHAKYSQKKRNHNHNELWQHFRDTLTIFKDFFYCAFDRNCL